MDVVVVVVVAVLVLGLVAVAGTRILRGSRRGPGMHNALGSFIDVFDPGQHRAEEDLKSQRHSGAIIPSPDDDDPPVVVDLDAGHATIKRPRNTGQG